MGPSEAYQNLLGRAEVSYFDSLPANRDEVLSRIGDAELIINIRSSVAFSDDILKACPKLKMLSLWGTGTDHVDLGAAARRGVTVTNTPGVSAYAMAEHALALMLAVARNIPQIDAVTKQGEWPRGFITQLHGKTLGVIGLGAIGRQTARIARGIGMNVIAWTMHPSPKLAQELGVTLVELDELYRTSDVVSLHLRLSPDTTGFLGAREFGLMKPTALFINTARGAITDEKALVEALEKKQIAAAGLDVFQTEPLPKGHPLTRLPNVVITPHSGGITKEALEAGLQLSIDNVFAFLEGKPQHVVAGPAA
jgi:D-3-phosphoglycerate dehydrogenase